MKYIRVGNVVSVSDEGYFFLRASAETIYSKS